MLTKKLFLVLVCIVLVASTFLSFNGLTGPVTAAVTKWPVIAAASYGGTISPSGLLFVDEGKDKTFKIKPSSGFHIADVIVDGKSKGRPVEYTFYNVTERHQILALFASILVIDAGAGPGGTISPSGPTAVQKGKSITFTITPDPGYYIASLLVDRTRVAPVRQFTFKAVSAPHSIMAIFGNIHPVLISASPGGSISSSIWKDNFPLSTVDDGSSAQVLMIESGWNLTCTMVPDSDNFHLVDVRIDGEWKGNEETYNITNIREPHDIMAVFDDTYSIAARAGPGGKIDPQGVVRVKGGEDQTFNFIPNNNYSVSSVIVDGLPVLPVPPSYTFEDVKKPHTIIVFFTKGASAIEELQEYQEFTED